MAEIFPDNLPKEYWHGPGKSDEKKVYDKLKSMSNEWKIVHAVDFQEQRQIYRRGIREIINISQGEADFIATHPEYGLIIVEVKASRKVRVKGGKLQFQKKDETKWRNYGPQPDGKTIKDPIEQVQHNARSVNKFLKRNLKKAPSGMHIPTFEIFIGICAVFPTADIQQDIGMKLRRDTIIDEYDLSNLEERLIEVSKKQVQGKMAAENGLYSMVWETLFPSRELTSTIRSRSGEVINEIQKLTDQQMNILDISSAFDRALIHGHAGTGKTLIAIEKARRLAKAGKSVLLLCYNRPLGEWIAQQTENDKNIVGGSIHSVFYRLLEGENQLDLLEDAFNKSGTDGYEEIIKSAELLDQKFDAVIIDEGQDFHPDWLLEIGVELFKKPENGIDNPENGILYIFSDPAQNVYGVEHTNALQVLSMPKDPLSLTDNLRNSRPIAEQVQKAFPEMQVGDSGVQSGDEPEFIHITQNNVQEKITKLLRSLLETNRVDPSEIHILFDTRDTLNDIQPQIAGLADGVGMETIHRFKGLETGVAIVVFGPENEVNPETIRTYAYVGMSRAKYALFVMGTGEVKEAIHW